MALMDQDIPWQQIEAPLCYGEAQPQQSPLCYGEAQAPEQQVHIPVPEIPCKGFMFMGKAEGKDKAQGKGKAVRPSRSATQALPAQEGKDKAQGGGPATVACQGAHQGGERVPAARAVSPAPRLAAGGDPRPGEPQAAQADRARRATQLGESSLQTSLRLSEEEGRMTAQPSAPAFDKAQGGGPAFGKGKDKAQGKGKAVRPSRSAPAARPSCSARAAARAAAGQSSAPAAEPTRQQSGIRDEEAMRKRFADLLRFQQDMRKRCRGGAGANAPAIGHTPTPPPPPARCPVPPAYDSDDSNELRDWVPKRPWLTPKAKAAKTKAARQGESPGS